MARRTRGARSLIAAAAVALMTVTVGCGPSSGGGAETAAPAAPVAQDTSLAVHAADTSVSFGSGVEVTFDLSTPGGALPAAATAAVMLGTTVVDQRVAVSKDGTASVEFAAADLTPGPHVITVAYAGDSAFEPATGRTTFTVTPAGSVVALSLAPIGTGATTASVAVTTTTGIPADGAVAFSVDGAPAGEAPVADGAAAVEIPAGLALGDHAVAANFTPAAVDRVAAGAGSATLTISKTATTVLATGRADALRYGDDSGFTVSVTPVGPPADLTGAVTVAAGGTPVAQGTTDAAGAVTLDFVNTFDPGTQTYTVSYAGNDKVEPAQSDFAVTTTRTDVDIKVAKPTLKPGESGTVTVSVVGSPQTPTGSATVTVDGAVVAEGALDGAGKITAPVTAVTVGTHTIGVSYTGDVRFDADSATSKLTVKAPLVNPNADGAAAINANNPCPVSASACVDLSNERAWLQSGGQVTYGPVSITSGRKGYRTPAGTFSAYWFDKDHKSSIYEDAPMPNSVFFNNDIAFHQGSLSVQSHGCIHLSSSASATFFNALSVGDTVSVWGAAPY